MLRSQLFQLFQILDTTPKPLSVPRFCRTNSLHKRADFKRHLCVSSSDLGTFCGEAPLAPYISDEEEFELWDRIVDGLKVDIDRIEFEEARTYVKECLSIPGLI